MHDHVHETVLDAKLRGLKSRRQFLMRRLADDARAGEADHALRLGHDDVADTRIAGHHARGRRIGEHGNVRQPCIRMPRECAACLCHLHEREHAFVHAGTAAGADDDDREPLRGRALDGAGDFFTDDTAHRRGEKSEIHHGDAHPFSLDAAETGDDGVALAGGLLVFFQAVGVAGLAGEFERVHGGELRVVLLETAVVRQQLDTVERGEREVVLALRADAGIALDFEVVDDLTTAGTFRPKAGGQFTFFAGGEDRLGEDSHGILRVRLLHLQHVRLGDSKGLPHG